ncbi:MAG: polysaccharide biosynthesis tyrosine autokinase [Flavobacteriaceae bacterium]|nr:polysaccharide biosynthesis tyrosine autokinase [Flavobacteriaceae bacterium]
MNLNDFTRTVRTRWVTITVSVLIGVLGGSILTLLTPPLYQASTRLFVSTTVGASASELYQGNRLSQERVLSYIQLLVGETLAQRTIDKLGLEMSAEDLRDHLSASAKLDTVLIDVDVQDESPLRARDIANALSDEFVVMVRELETPRPGAQPDARVVVEQRASIPSKPVEPKPVRNVAFGFLLGLLFGVGVAILRDLLDNTVKDRETVEAITGAGLLGAIPFDKNRMSEPPINFESDNSPIAEAFRKLRTNLRYVGVDDPPRCIVVTSSIPGEGKSTAALNIALALAETNCNVAIVDGDLRRPTLGRYLNAIETVGLSTVLSGQVSLSEVLQDTQFPCLTLLTAGGVPPNPSELLASQAASQVFAELRRKFDYVIIDSPPLLAVTDGAIIATEADGVLVAERHGVVRRDQLEQAIATLRDINARILGAVLNMVPSRGGGYYNYGYQPEGPRSFNSYPVSPSAIEFEKSDKALQKPAPVQVESSQPTQCATQSHHRNMRSHDS